MATMTLLVTEHHDGPGYGFPHTLWVRDLDFEAPPVVGDDVEMVADVTWSISRRWHEIDGSLGLELQPIVLNPNDEYETSFSRRLLNDTAEKYLRRSRPWREGEDPELAPLLEAAGWTRWRPSHAAD